MTHSNTTIHNIDQQNQTISNCSNLSDLTSSLNLYEPINQAILNGSRVYHLVGTFIGSANNNSFETIFTSYFLQNRGRLNSVDSDGNNALHIAIEKNDFDNAIKLIALGINRFHQNNEGLDPLEYASQKNSTKIQNLLRDIRPDRTSSTQSQSENRPSSLTSLSSASSNLSSTLSSGSSRPEASFGSR